MIVYWFNLVLVLIWSLLAKINKYKYSSVFYLIIFIQLFLLLALRSLSVGYDIGNYLNTFEMTKFYSFWDFGFSRFENGYLLLNKIFIFIQNNQLFISIVALIPMLLFFKGIIQESKIPWLSMYLFVTLGIYAMAFNVLRQIIAMSLIFVSYKYLRQNNLLKFSLYVFMASLFHFTSIAFLLIYPFRNLKLRYRNIMLYLILSITTYVFSRSILLFFISKFSSVQYGLRSGGDLPLLIVMIITIIAGVFFHEKVLNINPRSIVLYNILFVGILIQILALDFTTFSRVTSYFMMFMVVFIPEVLSTITSRHLRFLGIFLIVLITGVRFYLGLSLDPNGIVPYSLFF